MTDPNTRTHTVYRDIGEPGIIHPPPIRETETRQLNLVAPPPLMLCLGDGLTPSPDDTYKSADKCNKSDLMERILSTFDEPATEAQLSALITEAMKLGNTAQSEECLGLIRDIRQQQRSVKKSNPVNKQAFLEEECKGDPVPEPNPVTVNSASGEITDYPISHLLASAPSLSIKPEPPKSSVPAPKLTDRRKTIMETSVAMFSMVFENIELLNMQIVINNDCLVSSMEYAMNLTIKYGEIIRHYEMSFSINMHYMAMISVKQKAPNVIIFRETVNDARQLNEKQITAFALRLITHILDIMQ